VNKRVAAVLVVVIVLVSLAGYYEYSSYERAVVQTSIVNGDIKGIETSSGGGGGLAIGGGGAKGATTSGISLVTVSVGSTSFTQVLACISPTLTSGEKVQVADQLLRNGQHEYIANIACPGNTYPFKSMHITQTSSSSSSSSSSLSSSSSSSA
jgi:hypothetical protein